MAVIDAARAGDRAAFGELYTAFHGVVYRYVYWRLGLGGNTHTAEDITADVFVRALRGIGRFEWRDGHQFGAWLVTIARNLLADRWKSAAVQRCKPFPYMRWHDEETDTLLDLECAPAAEDLVVDELVGDELWAAVDELTPAQRTCLILRYRRQLTTAETAREMGSTETRVKALTYRATRSLRRRVEALR